MTKEIEKLIRLTTLRDVELQLLKDRQDGYIVPDSVIEVLRDLEIEYTKKELQDPFLDEKGNDEKNER